MLIKRPRISLASIFTQSTTWLSLVAVFLILSSSIWTYFSTNRLIQISQERRELALGESLALAISDLIISREYSQIENDLKQIMGNESVKSVLVSDLSGKVLAYLKRNKEHDKAESDFILTQINIPNNIPNNFTVIKENNISILLYKINPGVPLGWVRLESFNSLGDTLLNNFRTNIILTIITLFIGILGFSLSFFYRAKQKSEININELKKASTDREVRLQEIQENQRIKSMGVLISGLAHEINNPLGIVLTATTHISRSAANIRTNLVNLKPAALTDFLEDEEIAFQLIFDNLRRASDLLKGFREIDSNRVLDDIKEINLREYIQSIEQSLTPVLKNTRCKLKIDIDPTIAMKVSTGSLNQLITNLVLNSTIHAFEGLQDSEIKIVGVQDSQYIVLKISDNGKGISPQVLPNLFTPFYTTNRNKGGTGLGLYMSRQIASDVLKGSLNVENLPDKGCEFTLKIPRH